MCPGSFKSERAFREVGPVTNYMGKPGPIGLSKVGEKALASLGLDMGLKIIKSA